MTSGGATIGLDVGGTKLLAVVLDQGSHTPLAIDRRATPRGAEALIDGMVAAVADLS